MKSGARDRTIDDFRPAAARLLALAAALFVAACSTPPPPMAGADQIAALAHEIAALSPEVDPAEADRAAHVAYSRAFQLSHQYGITDPPLVHNTKVNAGLRPRGLCWHWAQDMETRLAQEHFETLDLHRAIANFDNPIRIEHSTVIVSAKGQDMYDGIVLDAWRKGGRLTWIETTKDRFYKWRPQREVLLAKQQRRARKAN